MSDGASTAHILDALRPHLMEMAAEILAQARSEYSTPTLLPGTVSTYDITTGNCLVSPDGGGASVPARSLLGGLVPGARVLLLFQPPSGVFVAYSLSTDPQALSVRCGGRWSSTAVQAVNSAAVTNLNMDTEEDDTDGFLTPTSNHATIPAGLDGIYIASATGNFAAAVGANRAFIQITASSRANPARAPYGNAENLATVTDLFNLAAGDTMTPSVFQSSGAPINNNAIRMTLYRLFSNV